MKLKEMMMVALRVRQSEISHVSLLKKVFKPNLEFKYIFIGIPLLLEDSPVHETEPITFPLQ